MGIRRGGEPLHPPRRPLDSVVRMLLRVQPLPQRRQAFPNCVGAGDGCPAPAHAAAKAR